MDYNIFTKYNQFADFYRQSRPNIYFFLKDCGFQYIYKINNNRFPTQDSQNMFNGFQAEMSQAQWQRNKISKMEYSQFLEEFFKKVDFNKVDLESCEIMKILTENNKVFGNVDNLTNQRIDYFNKKIQKLQSTPNMNTGTINIFSLLGISQPNTPQTVQLPSSSSSPSPYGQINTNDILPNAVIGFKTKPVVDPEMERLNGIMKQMKLSTPVCITNVQPGQYYNPYTMPNYIPQGVNSKIPLPMKKTDPNYVYLKQIIENELILANQELDYHKIDMARIHLEKAAYYLKNVIE